MRVLNLDVQVSLDWLDFIQAVQSTESSHFPVLYLILRFYAAVTPKQTTTHNSSFCRQAGVIEIFSQNVSSYTTTSTRMIQPLCSLLYFAHSFQMQDAG